MPPLKKMMPPLNVIVLAANESVAPLKMMLPPLKVFRKEVEEGDPKAPAGLPTLLRCQQGVLRSKASLRGLYDIRHRHPDVQFLMTSHLSQGCPENLLVLTACC
ncbi:hypothetical protein FJT64_025060 [Amphibalanus amphitrite]|uniref:Uncharacterized protein n=1 Tax=Amphibalanus amphitrite TaxID=1232801 RepID=A0A6A4WL38_AMPAM|nr:hypothetical protein FJT64_025060 [Amphibalanus amphitrite]